MVELARSKMCLCTYISMVYGYDIYVFFVSGGDVAKEHHNIKHAVSSTPFTMGKHLGPNSQMELVGHSIVRSLNHILQDI